jgi:hypothetical protein
MLSSILNKHREGIPAFLTWFEYIEKNNVTPNNIANAIDYIKNMQPLQQQKEDLLNQIVSLESEGLSCKKHWANQKLVT